MCVCEDVHVKTCTSVCGFYMHTLMCVVHVHVCVCACMCVCVACVCVRVCHVIDEHELGAQRSCMHACRSVEYVTCFNHRKQELKCGPVPYR